MKRMRLLPLNLGMLLAAAVPVLGQDTLSHAAQEKLWTGYTPGAVTVVERRDFNKGMIHNPLQLVQGRVAGLQVARPGGDPNGYFQSRLRGLHTFGQGCAEPLIVVDGFPQASLLTVDPEDIASMTVLRDAASCARYGLRGASGVILIRTKGLEEKKGWQVQYRGAVSVEAPAFKPAVLEPAEFRAIFNDPGSPFFRPGFDLLNATDWVEEITRTGMGQWHQVNVGRATEMGSYRFAMHFRDADGIARNSGFNQLNGHFSGQQSLWNNRIELGANLGYARREAQHIVADVFRLAQVFNPTMPIRSDTALTTGGYAQLLAFSLANPVALLEQLQNEGSEGVTTANLHGVWQVLPGLQLSGRYALQHYDAIRGFAAPKDEYVYGLVNGGYAQRYTDNTLNQFVEAAIDYRLSLGKNQLLFNAGFHSQRLRYETELTTGRNFQAAGFSYEDLAVDGPYETAERNRTEDEHLLSGAWGQVHYRRGGLSLSGMLRRDGSSRLGRNQKWAWLPAVQAAYDLRALLGAEAWDVLQLRSSYAWAGNTPQRSFLSLLTYRDGQTFYYDSTFIPSQVPLHYSNPELKREIRKEWNMGFDWALPDRRFFMSADYFRSRAVDLIREVFQRVQIGGIGDLTYNRYANVADLINTGLEINMGGTIIQEERFSWSLNANAWWSRTRVGKLTKPPFDPDAFPYYGFIPLRNDLLFRLAEHRSFGEIWASEYESINQAGFWVLKGSDIEDALPSGSAVPLSGAGISSRMEWGGFDLQVFLRGVFGHSKVDPLQFLTSSRFSFNHYNLSREVLEEPLSRLREGAAFSDFYIREASFFRLDNVVLGYTLPKREGKLFSGWRVYVAGQNLLTISPYTWGDPEPYLAAQTDLVYLSPEISARRYGIPRLSAIQPGPDPITGTYFPTRTFVVGIEARF